jgi:hypothetical protein
MNVAMTPEVARAIFDAAYAAEPDPDKRARLELLREYFCNPDFRRGLHDFAWTNRN